MYRHRWQSAGLGTRWFLRTVDNVCSDQVHWIEIDADSYLPQASHRPKRETVDIL